MLDFDGTFRREVDIAAVDMAAEAPPSVILRNSDSDITWKPPESVSTGPCQRMNARKPPRRAMRSAVGRSIR
jgi:hypothetical protein